MKNFNDRLITLEDKVEKQFHSLELVVMPLKEKVEKLHDWKGESNNLLQNFKGMIEILKKSQEDNIKVLREEMQNISKSLSEDSKKLSSDIANLINFKFILVGGASVGIVMATGAYYMFKMYLDYKGIK